MLLFTAVVILGCLYPCDAGLPAVGNCTFMNYYCSLRNYESTFFKALKEGTSSDCGLQFWNLFYRSLKKSKECLKPEPKLKVANIEKMESLYCSGRDLEIPLVSSLSLCSPKHKSKVDKCISDYAEAFSKDPSDKSLCRKRGRARMCVSSTWDAFCDNITAVSSGILKNITAEFNPFCDGESDPWGSGEDLCKPVTTRDNGAGRREYSITALWRSVWLYVPALYVWE